jgi:hypothetical protein
MQTSAGVDVRKLEAEDDDAPMKLPTVSLDLRLAISQARQVLTKDDKFFHGTTCCAQAVHKEASLCHPVQPDTLNLAQYSCCRTSLPLFACTKHMSALFPRARIRK